MGFISALRKLTRPYDEDDEFTGFAPQTYDSKRPGEVEEMRSSAAGFAGRRNDGKVVSIFATARLQVVIFKPDRFDAAAEIADHLKAQRTVVLNLEQLDTPTARRIIDFVSGACYAQEGNIRRIAERSYIVTPYNVSLIGDISGELESQSLYY